MSDYTVTKARIHAGTWEGLVTGPKGTEPQIAVMHQDEPLQGVALTADPAQAGSWQLRITIPPELLGDGVQVFLINDAKTGEKLDSFTIITGEPLDDDIRAELRLVRAELDMLKKAFRRHCLESA